MVQAATGLLVDDLTAIQGLEQRVYSSKRCKLYSDVTTATEEWESNVLLFDKVEERTLGESYRIYGIRQIVPEELGLILSVPVLH